MLVGVQSSFPWELFAESLASLLGYENKKTNKKITESQRANQRHLLTRAKGLTYFIKLKDHHHLFLLVNIGWRVCLILLLKSESCCYFFSLHRWTFDNFSCLIMTLRVVNNRKILINIHSLYFKIVLIKIDFETHWFPNKNQR